jgi:hypothetical protein
MAGRRATCALPPHMLRRSERIADLAKRRLAATAIIKPAPRPRRRHVHRYALPAEAIPSLPVLGPNESEDRGAASFLKLPKGAKWPKGTIKVTIEVPPELGWLEFGDKLQIAGGEAAGGNEEKKEKKEKADDEDDDDNEEEEEDEDQDEEDEDEAD